MKTAILLFAFLLACFITKTEAVGTVVLNQLNATNAAAVSLNSPTYSPNASIGSINTTGISVTQQYELNAVVQTVSLSGGSVGINIAGNLGAQLVSTNGSISVYSGNTTSLTGNIAQFISQQNFAVQSTSGDSLLSSSVGLSMVSGAQSFSSPSIQLSAVGDTNFKTRNDLSINAGSLASFSFSGAQLTSNAGDIDLASGNLLDILSSSDITVSGRRQLAFTSSGSIETVSASSLTINTHSLDASILNDITISSPNQLTLSSQQQLSITGSAANIHGDSIAITGTNQYSAVQFVTNGNYNINTVTGDILISSTGLNGKITFSSQTSSTSNAVNQNALTANTAFQIGSSSVTQNVDFTGPALIFTSGSDFSAYASDTFTFSGIDQLAVSSPSAIITRAQNISMLATDQLSITAGSESIVSTLNSITLISAANFNLVGSSSGTISSLTQTISSEANIVFNSDSLLINVEPGFPFIAFAQNNININSVTFNLATQNLYFDAPQNSTTFVSQSTTSMTAADFYVNAGNTASFYQSGDFTIKSVGTMDFTAGQFINVNSQIATLYITSTQDELSFIADILSISSQAGISATASGNVYMWANTATITSPTVTISLQGPGSTDFKSTAISVSGTSKFSASGPVTQRSFGSTSIATSLNSSILASSTTQFLSGGSLEITTGTTDFQYSSLNFNALDNILVSSTNNSLLNTTSMTLNVFGDVTFSQNTAQNFVSNSASFNSIGYASFQSDSLLNWNVSGSFSFISSNGDFSIDALSNIFLVSTAQFTLSAQNISPFTQYLIFSGLDFNSNTNGALSFSSQTDSTFSGQTVSVTSVGTSGATITTNGLFNAVAGNSNILTVNGNTTIGGGSVSITSGSDQSITVQSAQVTAKAGQNIDLIGNRDTSFSVVGVANFSSNTFSFGGNHDLTLTSGSSATFNSISHDINFQSSGYMLFDAAASITINSSNSVILTAGNTNVFYDPASLGQGSVVIYSGGLLGCVISYSAQTHDYSSSSTLFFDAGASIETLSPNGQINFDVSGEAFFHSSTQATSFTAVSSEISVNTQDAIGNIEIQSVNSGIWLLSPSQTSINSINGNFRFYGKGGVFVNTTAPGTSVMTIMSQTADVDILGARNVTIGSIFGDVQADITNNLEIQSGDSILMEASNVLNIVSSSATTVTARSGYNINIVSSTNFTSYSQSSLTLESLLDNIYITSQTGSFNYNEDSIGLLISSALGPINFESRGQQRGNAGIQVQTTGGNIQVEANRDINISANNQGYITASDPNYSNIFFTVLAGSAVFETQRIGDDILISATTQAQEKFYDIDVKGDNIDFSSTSGTTSFNGVTLDIGQSSTPIIRIQTGSGMETAAIKSQFKGNGFEMQSASNLELSTQNTLTISSTNDTLITSTQGSTDISTLGLLQIVTQGSQGFIIEAKANNISVAGSLSLSFNALTNFDITSVLDQNFVSNGFDPASSLSFESQTSIINNIGSYLSTSSDHTQVIADNGISYTGTADLYIESLSPASNVGLLIESDGALTFDSPAGVIQFTLSGQSNSFVAQNNTYIGIGSPADSVQFSNGDYSVQTEVTKLPITGSEFFTTSQFFNFLTQQDQHITITQKFSSQTNENLIINSGSNFTISARDDITLASTGDIVHSSGGSESISSKSDGYNGLNIFQAAGELFQTAATKVSYSSLLSVLPTAFININSYYYSTFSATNSFTTESLSGNLNLENNGYNGFLNISSSTGSGMFSVANGDMTFTSTGGINYTTPQTVTFSTPTSITAISDTDVIFNAGTSISFSGTSTISFNADGTDGNTLNGIYSKTGGSTTFSTPKSYSINARDQISFYSPGSVTLDAKGSSFYFNAFGRDQNVTFTAPNGAIAITAPKTEISSTYDVNFLSQSTLTLNSTTITLLSSSAQNDIFFNINAAEYQEASSIVLSPATSITYTAANNFIAKATTPASGTSGYISISTSAFSATAIGNINLQATQSIQSYPSSLTIDNLSQLSASNLISFTSTGSTTTALNAPLFQATSGKDTTISTPTALTFTSLTATTTLERADITLLALGTNQLLFETTQKLTGRSQGSSGSINFAASSAGIMNLIGNNHNVISKGGYQVVVSSNSDPTNGITITGTCPTGGSCGINPIDGGPQSLTIRTSAIGPSNIDYPPYPIIDNGIGRLEFVSEFLLTLNVQTAGKAIQFDNFYARLGFFSDINDAVVIQTGSIQGRETCAYSNYVCMVPNFHNAGNVNGVFNYLDNIEDKIELALINYGLLNYKTSFYQTNIAILP